LHYYEGSFVKALLRLFPDIGLDSSKFKTKQQPKNSSCDQIVQQKDFLKVNDPPPDTRLDPTKLALIPRGYWMNTSNRKEFFEEFAKINGFDSLIAQNWYSVTKKQILEHKSAGSVLIYYEGSFIAALQDLYPTLNLDENKFSILPKNFWTSPTNQKQYFVDLAEQIGFDPLIADNWYSISPFHIRNYKGIGNVTLYYGGKYEVALLQLFPDIGLEKNKFNV